MSKKICVILGALTILFVFYFLAVSYFYPEISERGQFGDMFGGINAVFSGLAFLGVIYAILLQREELGLQRKELELTRNELKRAAEAQEKSQEALTRQAASLKATAKLNGLSALLQRYTTLRDVGIARYGNGGVDRQWDEKASDVTQEIERIIQGK